MHKIVLGFVMLPAACGAPSSFDLCHELCDVNKKCGTLSDAQAANCHTDCNNRKGALTDQDAQCERDCTNCAKIRSDYGACGGVDCNKVISCVQNVDQTCIRK
jgi:hypothetical protein